MSKNACLLTRYFGKADAKVVFFFQSTKFISKNFQKNFDFALYFDPHQGKSPSKKGPFTQNGTFVQSFGAKNAKIRRKSPSSPENTRTLQTFPTQKRFDRCKKLRVTSYQSYTLCNACAERDEEKPLRENRRALD